jgi:hypothetical protein
MYDKRDNRDFSCSGLSPTSSFAPVRGRTRAFALPNPFSTMLQIRLQRTLTERIPMF